MNILIMLKNPVIFFLYLGLFSIFGAINTYLLVSLPGSNGYACILGGNITLGNILFSVLLSAITALLLLGIWKMPKTCNLAARSKVLGITGISATSGVFTIFCPVCTLPIISLFGLSIGYSWFVDFGIYFKTFSLLLSFGGLYFVNKKLNFSYSPSL